MTRRVIKPQPPEWTAPIRVDWFHPTVVDRQGIEQEGDEIFGAFDEEGEWGRKSPYGAPGDRLWVRETWAPYRPPSRMGEPTDADYWYRATADPGQAGEAGVKWKPSIHMPREASRLTLEVTGVRVERIQEISKEDCIVEGITKRGEPTIGDPFGRRVTWTGADGHQYPWARAAFASLWESINAKRGYGWKENPWVWVVEFRRLNDA